MTSTVIAGCTCQHEFQDKEYGKGNRVFNVGEAGKDGKCTACGHKKAVK